MSGSFCRSGFPSERSRGVALALAALLGPFGAHRFYVGKTGTGVLMLCTVGGLGLWYLYDVIMVAGGSFRDIDGRSSPAGTPRVPAVGTPSRLRSWTSFPLFGPRSPSWPSGSTLPSGFWPTPGRPTIRRSPRCKPE